MSFWRVEKNNNKLPEDGVDKRQNASELKSDQLRKSVH